MLFLKTKQRQVLDFSNDLLLTQNPDPVYARMKSHAPRAITNFRYVAGLRGATFRRKLWATMCALVFIWGRAPGAAPAVSALPVKTDGEGGE